MNVVVLLGRLTRDPELRYTPQGRAVLNFSLAVQRNKDDADFINCVAWEKTAEAIAGSLAKGSQCCIQGRLQTRSYDAQDGTKRTVVEVVCGTVKFVGSRPERAADSADAGAADEEEVPF